MSFIYFDLDKGDWYCATCRTFIGDDPDCGECESRIDTLLVSGDHDVSAS
jgi:hypothetical protein